MNIFTFRPVARFDQWSGRRVAALQASWNAITLNAWFSAYPTERRGRKVTGLKSAGLHGGGIAACLSLPDSLAHSLPTRFLRHFPVLPRQAMRAQFKFVVGRP